MNGSTFAERDTIIVLPSGDQRWTTSVAVEVAGFYTDLDGAYELTHVYDDGSIRVAECDGDEDHKLFKFIKPDGTVTRPTTWAWIAFRLKMEDERFAFSAATIRESHASAAARHAA